ncbi:Sbal_3080 family lipoprotein [Cupriavidus metallidurans]|uniref:Sbal_3080 family lipoprotein n=1 Tax=Cupriavidus metallidurans TaxID=119219 RepID=UPI001CCCBD57|nr:Sbal_3080 family lipoprotein [Cupriavidus metallidurans]UBM11007.1 Sbal_3080 family lipoprotein [Cupriavidus metallidurans]
MKRATIAAMLALLASGCSTYQAVTPVDQSQADPIASFQPGPYGGPAQFRVNGNHVVGADGALFCIIPNQVNGNAYVENFADALRARNFEVKVLQPYSSVAACPMTATYTAQRQTFVTPFLVSVDITVFRNGERAGKAIYNANRSAGGINLSHLIQPDAKIDELVDQLFPGLKPQPVPAQVAPAPTPGSQPSSGGAAPAA